MRVIQASHASADGLAALARYGIARHSDQRTASRPAPSSSFVSKTWHDKTVTYASSCVWLTGALHFGNDVERWHQLELCDAEARVLAFVLDPSPDIVEQGVLIKHWVLVEPGSPSTASSFLEVHDEKMTLLAPNLKVEPTWTANDALRVLETKATTMDPPLYTSPDRWVTWTRHGDRSSKDKDVHSLESHDARARQRVHVVFGRVTTVSPIAHQKVCANSHFFVEIEAYGVPNRASQSVVNVMFTGLAHLRWHAFLRPGKVVLVSDLVLVRSRECDAFLLQTTPLHRDSTITPESLETVVLIWAPAPSTPRKPVEAMVTAARESYRKDAAIASMGQLMEFQGQVDRILWDDCIELLGREGTRVLVCLFQFPYPDDLLRVRKGTVLQLWQAHVLLWPTPLGDPLVLGLCPRSHVRITRFGALHRPWLPLPPPSRRKKRHKKWARFGALHRQPLSVSMWLLHLFEKLSQKFFFQGEAILGSPVSFPGLRRRQAAWLVAHHVNVTLFMDQEASVGTLGARFLDSHASSPRLCPSIDVPRHEKHWICSRLVTIQELRTLGLSTLHPQSNASMDKPEPPSRIVDLAYCLLLGSLCGNVESGDLRLVDRTGSMAMRLTRGRLDVPPGRGVYLVHAFDLVIEPLPPELHEAAPWPWLLSVACAADHVAYLSFLDKEAVPSPLSGTTGVHAIERKARYVLVTQVDPVPLSTSASRSLVPEYRVLHGLVCPVGARLSTPLCLNAVYRATLVVRTHVATWFVQTGTWYHLDGPVLCQDTRRSNHETSEDAIIQASMEYWVQASHDVRPPFDRWLGQDRPFRLFQVEAGNGLVPVCFEEGAGTTRPFVCERYREQWAQRLSSWVHAIQSDDGACAKLTSVPVAHSELVALWILTSCRAKLEKVVQVSELLCHPVRTEVADGGRVQRNGGNVHTPQLISVIGLIVKKRYMWYHRSGQAMQRGRKRGREDHEGLATRANRHVQCLVTIRDLQRLDTVEIRIDTTRFGWMGTLYQHTIVKFLRLHGLITRSSFKVYLNWSHVTAAQVVSHETIPSVPSNAELYGTMPTRFLNDLYSQSYSDKRLHRYVVGVVHMSYVVLKRKCSVCHQKVLFDQCRGLWQHPMEATASHKCASQWYQCLASDPALLTRTYVGTTVRCVIDDGSGQADLFLENDVAWELLTCPVGQRRRFDEILSLYVDELRYFFGHTLHGSFATSKAEREQEYYQNELRAFVLHVIPSLRSIVVYAQQFYKANAKEGFSILTFGKDIHVTTKTGPQPKLEAKRVDRLHVRSELQQRLASLRLRFQA